VILLWGLRNEDPLAAVEAALAERGEQTVVLDQHRIAETRVELDVAARGAGSLALNGQRHDLRRVKAAYLRPYEATRVAAVRRAGEGSALWQHAVGVDVLVATWAELTTARVVNRLEPMVANNSKVYQSEWIARLGFSVPETLVTTDPDAARAFWEQHDTVVYKSLSGTRSRVARLGRHHRDRLADVAACPTQFQRYVPGCDYRVHVVGAETYACSVVSETDDYRYGDDVEVAAAELPDEVAERCVRTAREMSLEVAGLDLRLTPDGEWFCFEVNPSPGFTFYEHRTGQPIAHAIAALLAAAPDR
jgi:hypothetical protein